MKDPQEKNSRQAKAGEVRKPNNTREIFGIAIRYRKEQEEEADQQTLTTYNSKVTEQDTAEETCREEGFRQKKKGRNEARKS
ncbi:hypothetical protein JTB14_005794 [Gonioctena quinquepunctata]|nr:hypothetical protein JTB14_005794 [Gonioctena quinquepunctata]